MRTSTRNFLRSLPRVIRLLVTVRVHGEGIQLIHVRHRDRASEKRRSSQFLTVRSSGVVRSMPSFSSITLIGRGCKSHRPTHVPKVLVIISVIPETRCG